MNQPPVLVAVAHLLALCPALVSTRLMANSNGRVCENEANSKPIADSAEQSEKRREASKTEEASVARWLVQWHTLITTSMRAPELEPYSLASNGHLRRAAGLFPRVARMHSRKQSPLVNG